jgi:hypothetical protein
MAQDGSHTPFTQKNWSIFIVGLVTIGLGYLCLRVPPVDGFLSLTLAPLMLILGYCVLVPWAIMTKAQTGEAINAEKQP